MFIFLYRYMVHSAIQSSLLQIARKVAAFWGWYSRCKQIARKGASLCGSESTCKQIAWNCSSFCSTISDNLFSYWISGIASGLGDGGTIVWGSPMKNSPCETVSAGDLGTLSGPGEEINRRKNANSSLKRPFHNAASFEPKGPPPKQRVPTFDRG
jgi:hypothetical protein